MPFKEKEIKMKRIRMVVFTAILCIALMTGSVAVLAEETANVTEAVTTEAVLETDALDTSKNVDTEAVADTEAVENIEGIDFEDYAEKFVDYLFSGAAGSTDIMDKIIAMGSQYLEAKEQGYTFQERLAQLLTPDNIMATAAAVFLVVIGIAFFVFKHSQTVNSRITTAEIARLRELYEAEIATNTELRETIKKQHVVIDELKTAVAGLSDKSDITKADMSHVNKLALATATMVKDVFMNSKTIDSSGKNLLLHDFNKALEESEKFGEVENADK